MTSWLSQVFWLKYIGFRKTGKRIEIYFFLGFKPPSLPRRKLNGLKKGTGKKISQSRGNHLQKLTPILSYQLTAFRCSLITFSILLTFHFLISLNLITFLNPTNLLLLNISQKPSHYFPPKPYYICDNFCDYAQNYKLSLVLGVFAYLLSLI